MNIESIFGNVLYATVFGSVVGVIIFTLKSTVLKRLPAKWQYIMWSVFIIKLVFPKGPESNLSVFNKINFGKTFTESELLAFAKKPFVLSKSMEANGFNIIPFIWLLGFIIILLWMVVSFLILNFKIRKAHIPSENTRNILERCKNVVGVKRKVSAVVQNHIITTSLCGIVNPKILITADFEKLDEKDIEYTFIHELSHFKRCDILMNYLLLFLRCVHWFNPIIWFLFNKIRRDIELATDEKTMLYINPVEYKCYGMTLINTLTGKKIKTPSLLGISADRWNMRLRIKAISKFKKPGFIQQMSGFLTIIFISFLCLTSAVVAKPISNMIYENIPNAVLPITEEEPIAKKIEDALPVEDVSQTEEINIDVNSVADSTEQDIYRGTGTIDMKNYAKLISYNSDSKERHSFIMKPNEDGTIQIVAEVLGDYNYIISIDISNVETPGFGWNYGVPPSIENPFYIDGLDPDEEYIVFIDTYAPGYYGIEGKILIY